VSVQSLDMSRFHGDLAKPLVHTGFAPGRAPVSAVEEIAHRLGKISQRLLLDRLTSGAKPGVLGAGLCQLCALLPVGGSFAARLPVPLLLHRQIPHVSCVAAVRQQLLLLLWGGQQAKPRHSGNLTALTDINGRSTPASLWIGFIMR
jgi:hypothetical protein